MFKLESEAVLYKSYEYIQKVSINIWWWIILSSKKIKRPDNINHNDKDNDPQ